MARDGGGRPRPAARADRGHPRRSRRQRAARARPWSGSPPRRGPGDRARPREAGAQRPSTRSSSTTSRAPRSASTPQRNEVAIVERDGEHHVPIASKDEVADAILDRVEALARAGPGRRVAAAVAELPHGASTLDSCRSDDTLHPLSPRRRAARGRRASARPPCRLPRWPGGRRRRARSARRSAAPTSATASSPRRRPSSRPWSRRHPVNDYAHFCLGRALSLTGQRERARHHLALASNLRPDATRLPHLPATACARRPERLCGRSSSGSAGRRCASTARRSPRSGGGLLVLLGVARERHRGGGRPARRQGPRRCGSSTTPTAA